MLLRSLALLLVLFSFSAQSFTYAGDYNHPSILKADQVDIKKALPPTPQPDSATWKKDFKTLHMWEKKRTEEQCKAGSHVVDISTKSLFGKPYGPLSDAEVAALDPVLDDVRWDVGYFTGKAKDFYLRPRPFVTDKTLNPCAKRETSFAYPSGHTSISRAIAVLLSKWDPKRKKEFIKRADEIGLGRIQVGVHHPSDVSGGKKIADYLVKIYLKDKEFMKRFNALPKPVTIK